MHETSKRQGNPRSLQDRRDRRLRRQRQSDRGVHHGWRACERSRALPATLSDGDRAALGHLAARPKERSSDYVEVADMLALASDIVNFSVRVASLELRDKLSRVVLNLHDGAKVDNGGIRRLAIERAAWTLRDCATEQAP